MIHYNSFHVACVEHRGGDGPPDRWRFACPAPDTRWPVHPQLAGDFRGPDACLLEPDDLGSLSPSGRHTALVAARAFALAMPSRWRSSMASRSACPTAPMTANISLPVAVPVSRAALPDIARTLSETILASSRATISSRSPTDLASLSSLVTVKVSPSRNVIQCHLKLLRAGRPMRPARRKSYRIRRPEARAPGLRDRRLGQGMMSWRSRPAWRFLSHMGL